MGSSLIAVQNFRPSGSESALNLSAPAVIKATLGLVARLIIISSGTTSGAFILNDCATLAAATAANEIFNLPFGSTSNVVGAIFLLEWPCMNGIVLSAVPGAGSPVCAISFG